MISDEKLNILEGFGDSDSKAMVEEIKYLREELEWAYLFILGELGEPQERAGWRAFNGLKKLGG